MGTPTELLETLMLGYSSPVNGSFEASVAKLRDPGLFDRSFSDVKAAALSLARGWAEYSTCAQPIKVAVMSGFNDRFLLDYLRLALFRRGLAAEIASSGYGLFLQEILAGDGALRTKPDVVFVLPSHRDIRCFAGLGATKAQGHAAAQEEAEFWRQMVERIGRPVVLLSFDQPPHRPLGELSGYSPSSENAHARRTNALLYEMLPPSASLVDAEALQNRLGPLWHDAYVYTLCKQPYAMAALPVVADALAAAAAAKLGKARKALVLDLDNTIWGGVVGDVGMSGLDLGPETPEGEAFTSFQNYVKALSRRGVVLALCSKNNSEIAWEAFCDHPAMVLKPGDIAAYVINFEDKASNIRSLAKTLNLGLDSLVFVDDNPIERKWIQEQLPEVAVVDLPENPALYADALDRANLFPMSALTSEDLSRSQSYRAVAIAREEGLAALDVESFLRDLRPVATVEQVGAANVDRIVHLIGKTNQFKMNPKLFDAAYILENAGSVVALRLSDRLQDYGIVAVAVTERGDGALNILNWVMSCRVFARRLEHVMTEYLWRKAATMGLAKLSVAFVASSRNAIVPDALANVGFEVRKDEGLFVLSDYPGTVDHHMKVVL